MSEIGNEYNPAGPAKPTRAGYGAVVVGVDGSPGSQRALHWAISEARARGTSVYAVLAWQVPIAAYAGPGAVGLADSIFGTQQVAAAAAAAEVLALKASTPMDPDVEMTYEPVEGHPAAVLVDASRDACCLVVGSRGHGGFVGSLLGSVSQHVVQHATCPVVIIPTPRTTGPAISHVDVEPIQRHDSFVTLTGVAP